MMNERIQELAYQADAYSDAMDIGGKNYIGLRDEYFAELIVRECMKCSDPLISHYIDKHPEQEQALLLAAIADYSSEIKKHFGVEE
jgi:hypothetical protein